MPLTVMDILVQVILPGAIALAVTLAALLIKRPAGAMRVSIAAGVAIFVGGAAAMLAGGGLAPFYDIADQTLGQSLTRLEAPGWILLVLLPVGLALVIARELPRVPAVVVWVARVVIAFGLAPLLLQPMLRSHWETAGEKCAWIVGLGVTLLVVWFATRMSAGKTGGRLSLLLTAISAATLAVIAAMSGSISIGVVAGALASVMGMTWLGWLLAGRAAPAGVVDLATILLLAVAVYVSFFLDMVGHAQTVLLIVAPSAAIVPRLKPLARRGIALRACATAVVFAIPLAVAVGLAVKANADAAAEEAASDDGGIDYSEYY